MAYEIDFIGVSAEKASKDADAICLRWKVGYDRYDNPKYKVGVIDGGFNAHGEAMVEHMNMYYFDDADEEKSLSDKIIDFIVVTHPDQDHTNGIINIIENFNVKKIYMNRPWLYIDDLFDKVNDGRITKESLKKRFKEKYKTIADIEDLAMKLNIPIYESFQGTTIEDKLLILSPSKEFSLQLLVESEKTPLTEEVSLKNIYEKYSCIVKEKILSLFESWYGEMLRENITTSAENETSVVIRGIVDDSGFLLTGDAGIRALTESMDYMEKIGENIIDEISFYQIPHHGGRRNVSPSVLDRMLGEVLREGEISDKKALASVAEHSDHPLKMVTNAYIRRGIQVYSTAGKIVTNCEGDMPNRGWSPMVSIEFSKYVEDWEE